jgi:hypothetical protein
LSRVVFWRSESGGVLRDSGGEDTAFENKNDLVMLLIDLGKNASVGTWPTYGFPW